MVAVILVQMNSEEVALEKMLYMSLFHWTIKKLIEQSQLVNEGSRNILLRLWLLQFNKFTSKYPRINIGF